MPTIDEEKRALRAQIRAKLPAPGSEAHVTASRAAQERLASSDLVGGARIVGLYRALPSECGTALLAEALLSRGLVVCYPAVDGESLVLAFRRAGGVFSRGALGVEEPTGEIVPLPQIELLVVPAVAVDRQGGRLGRGRGHYDATLRAVPSARTVALVFDSQLVPKVPVGEHDRRVDAVCTNARLFRCERSGR